jgi:putative PIN family toxin of toxin-antitoxin system
VIGVTADTNVYVSAFVFAGVPRQFLLEAEAGRFRLAISDAILDELRGVLRDKFHWSESAVEATAGHLVGCATLVDPTEVLNVVPGDPDDNRVVECAVAAGSRFIVTGDGDLLRLGSYAGIQILRVTEFLTLVAGPPG